MRNKKGMIALFLVIAGAVVSLAIVGSHYVPKTTDTVANPGLSPFEVRQVEGLEESAAGGAGDSN